MGIVRVACLAARAAGVHEVPLPVHGRQPPLSRQGYDAPLVSLGEQVLDDDQGAGAAPGCGLEGALDVLGGTDLLNLELHP